ncbi:MAG: inositol monophosphatase [Parcubacteria group bacterium]|nr:inositol monophosphatase [Parcubacteria group bacterium]
MFKKFLIKTARDAGKILLKDYGKLKHKDIQRKTNLELVTKTDLKSEKFIIKQIEKKFPKHSILSEECGLIDKKSDYLWLIDPLDGTNNFIMSNPLFAVTISLAYKGEVVAGVGYAPRLKELYFTEKGQGAYLNGKRIRVSRENKLSESILLFCHGHKRRDYQEVTRIYTAFKMRCRSLRQLGSALLELGFVAAGRCESLMIDGLTTWDLATGVLLVKEAGGKVTDFHGKEWDLKSTSIVATNSKIHNKLLPTLKKISKQYGKPE